MWVARVNPYPPCEPRFLRSTLLYGGGVPPRGIRGGRAVRGGGVRIVEPAVLINQSLQ